MDSPSCAVCGQPIVSASGSPTLSLFFRGRRWVFCGAPCRLEFKRDASQIAEAHADRGLAPYPETAAPPPRPTRQSPFAELVPMGQPRVGPDRSEPPEHAGLAESPSRSGREGRGET